MNALVYVVAACGALLLGSIAISGTSDQELEALVEIASRQVDRAYLLPGADFSAYKKVRITSSEITFRKNWLRKMNRGGLLLAQRITQQDAEQILQDARSEFDETWAEVFTTAGYEVVSQRGADVLEIVPSVFDFYVNAPQTGRMMTESLTLEAGHASLALDLRDSVSGTLLGRIIDRGDARAPVGRLELTSQISTLNEFRNLFAEWADQAADRLVELTQASPVPEALDAGKEFPKRFAITATR
jgi:hypothetical protein